MQLMLKRMAAAASAAYQSNRLVDNDDDDELMVMACACRCVRCLMMDEAKMLAGGSVRRLKLKEKARPQNQCSLKWNLSSHITLKLLVD